MNPNTMPLEAETRVLIDRSLENLGWKLSGKDQNVYYEQPRSEAEKKKLCGKRPDYVLYSKDSDKPLIVIEAKKKGVRLDSALEQGIQYAKAIEAPLVFATDGVFCKAFHTVANRPPILNGEEIDEFIREALALRYLTSYEVNTVSPKVQYDRKELIRIFDEVFKKSDILYGRLRPALNKVAYPNTDGICSTDIIVLRAKDKNGILPELYSRIFRSARFNEMVLNGVSGGQLPRVDAKYLFFSQRLLLALKTVKLELPGI